MKPARVTLPESVSDLPVTFNVDPRNPSDLLAGFLALRNNGRTAGLWSKFVVGPERMAAPLVDEVAQAEAAKRAEYAKREESFERCDTDGFITQWAHGLTAQLHGVAAEVAQNGGYDLQPGLFDRTTGERVPAVLLHGDWGYFWRLCDPTTGKPLKGEGWINDTRGPGGAVAKAGMVVLGEWCKAEAKILSVGTGISGRAWAAAVRTDGGYPGRPGYGSK